MKNKKKAIEYSLAEKISAIENAPENVRLIFDIIAISNQYWGNSYITIIYQKYRESHNLSEQSIINLLPNLLSPYKTYQLFEIDNYITIRFEKQIQDWVVKQLFQNLEYLASLCKVFEEHPESYFSWDNERELFHRLRLAIFKNDNKQFVATVKLYKKDKQYNVQNVLNTFPDITDLRDISDIYNFDISIQAYYLEHRIGSIISSLKPHSAENVELLRYAIQFFEKNKRSGKELYLLPDMLLLYYFLRADWENLKAIRTYDIFYEHIIDGLLAFLRGDKDELTQQFEIGLKLYRQTLSSRKKYFQQFYGIFHTLSLFWEKEMLIDKAKTQIIAGEAEYTFNSAYLALKAFLLFRQSNDTASKQLLLQFVENNTIDASFAYIIISQFQPSSNFASQLDILSAIAMRNGYKWLAFELLTALKKVNVSRHNETIYQDLAAQVGYDSLQERFKKIEKWESLLFALSNMAVPVKKTNVENNSRLAWFIDFKNEIIQGREQIYSKNAWSVGKQIANSRLKSGDVSCMTEQDRRVASRAIEFNEYRPNQATIYFMRALKELVEHPLLFLANSPGIGIKLQEKKPCLEVHEVGNHYEIKFNVNFSEVGISLIKQTPTFYQVMVVKNEHINVKKILENQKIAIPKQAKKTLMEALDNISSLIEVRSQVDATDQSLPSVEADARTYIHLLPIGNGIHVQFYVKPFTTVPPYLAVGEGDELQVAILDEQRTRTKRNLKQEKNNAAFVVKQSTVLGQQPRNKTWELDNTEQALQLLVDLMPLQNMNTVVIEWPKGEKFKLAKLINFEHLTVNIKERNDWFELAGEVEVDEETLLDMQKILHIAKEDQQFIELSPGRFIALTNAFRRRLQEIDALVNQTKKGTLQIHPLVAPALEDFVGLIPNFKADKHWKEQQNKLKKAFNKKFNPPQNFIHLLRGYQVEGFEWLSRLAEWGVGACLADDMGLGKTVQALSFVQNRAEGGATLVVAPASVCRNWKSETQKFAPTLNPYLFGEGDRQLMIQQAGACDIIIVTYDLLQRESELFINKKFHTIILDEAQAIKNRQTKRSETAMQLNGDFKMIMTGTPLENHLGDLWNLFQFINPGLLATPQIFQERFVNRIEKQNDEKRREQLKRIIKPFILRRRKHDVLKELPEKTEITLTVELSEAERAFYEALRREAVAKLEAIPSEQANEGARHLRILAEIMRLRRAACNPKMVKPDILIESAKLRLFGEVVNELLENGHKALVFSQFVAHLEILRNYLEDKNITYQYLDGQTPSKKRKERIDAFQAGEGDIFLISLKAGGTGLNLTAADYVIHMDPWWNPAVEDQASDRAHRFGQTRPVTVYRLVAAATIEEKILQLHEHKRDLADSLLDGTDVSARLSADDLMDLLKEY